MCIGRHVAVLERGGQTYSKSWEAKKKKKPPPLRKSVGRGLITLKFSFNVKVVNFPVILKWVDSLRIKFSISDLKQNVCCQKRGAGPTMALPMLHASSSFHTQKPRWLHVFLGINNHFLKDYLQVSFPRSIFKNNLYRFKKTPELHLILINVISI